MSEKKYQKNVYEVPKELAKHGPAVPIFKLAGVEFGVDAMLFIHPITAPIMLAEEPHKHEFQQFLCFVGTNPKNVYDLGAEIEITLGEEGEKFVVTTPTIVKIPAGLVHCPLNYKRIDRPVFHMDLFLGSEYKRL